MHKLLFLIKVLLISNVLSTSMAMADAKMLSWQDLLPELDDNFSLDDGINGERVRIDLNEQDVRIPGFMVPLEYKEARWLHVSC